MVFASDEFYITAERPIPDAHYYEEYPQYENGVGLLRSLSDEVDAALDMQEEYSRKRKVSLATGTLAGGFHKELVKRISARFPTFECNVYPIVNHFFGETITVAGLVTGGDLIEQLKGQDLGEELIIPKVMLKADEDIFLDDVTLDEVREALDIKITPIANDGYDYLDALLGNI
jgi:NifB/MoaA-like Fe-S oxidoreductase